MLNKGRTYSHILNRNPVCCGTILFAFINSVINCNNLDYSKRNCFIHFTYTIFLPVQMYMDQKRTATLKSSINPFQNSFTNQYMQTVAQKKIKEKTGGVPPLFGDCISKIKLIQIHLIYLQKEEPFTSSHRTGLMLHCAHPFATHSWLKKVFCHNF